MKKMIITVVSVAAAIIGLATVDEVSRKGSSLAVKKVKNEVKSMRSEADQNTIDSYNDVACKLEALQAKEDLKVNKKVNEYKESIGYASRKKEITDLAENKVESFKESIGYSKQRELFSKEYNDSLNAWKAENTYDERIAAEKAKIDQAEKISKNQKFATEVFSDGSEYSKESSEKIVETIKEQKDKAIKEAKENIKAIEKEYEDHKKSVKKEYDSKISELNSKVSVVREEASKKSSEDLKALEEDVSNAKKSFKEEAYLNEPEEMKELSAKYDELEDKCKGIYKKENLSINAKINELDNSDITAAYFDNAGFGKIGTSLILAIPFVPIIFVLYKYGKFVFKVVSKVGGNS